MSVSSIPFTRHRRLAASVIALLLVAGACGNDDEAAPNTTVGDTTTTTTEAPPEPTSNDDERAWPVPDWASVDPADAGIDPEVLDEVVHVVEASGSDCLVVSRDGQLVGEWYWNETGPDFEREAWSVTKSITATLVGIAQDQGYLDIDQPASDFIDEWVGTDSEDVTIRNLLSNDSGRFQTAESDYVQMAAVEEDKTAFAIGLDQQHEIGTHWVYNNAAIQVLEAVLERATGTDVGTFAEQHLFGPLGMSTTIDTDVAGNTLTFMGAQMSCRDMARFGLLNLREGEWNGDQIVPADFVAEATRPSTELNPGYGLLWWLFGGDTEVLIETAPGQDAIPGGEPRAFAALGLGGQIIVVVPEHDLVVTRLVSNQTPGSEANLADLLPMLFDELVVD